MIKLFLEIVLMITLVGVGYFAYTIYSEDLREYFSTKQESYPVFIGPTALSVTVADTDAERAQGLSGTQKLNEFQGKLFVFDSLGAHGIWMKDMNYALDIMWFDDALALIHIEENVTPDTYPQVFLPRQDARYVLEVNAFFAEDYNLGLGDTLELPARLVR
jgi:uncharacterized membrane protein (UPF0127 family)